MAGTENGISPISINLTDDTGLDGKIGTPRAWVCGWINEGSSEFQSLQQDGSFTTTPSTSVSVQANVGWQDSGVQVAAGQTVTVTYVSGDWTADPKTNDGNAYDANGCPGLIVPGSQTAFPMPGVTMGALVGKVGESGTAFLIGDGPQVMPSGDVGTLYLCINDDLTGAYGAGLADNSGSVTVQIDQGVNFYLVSSIDTVTLSTQTNGSNRLVFVVATAQPAPLPVFVGNVMQYTAYPYANPPGIAAPGPFDIFEFGYDAQFDVSAVNGFGLNLSFTYDGISYGADPSFGRKQIGAAFSTFIANEVTAGTPGASAFAELLYDAAISGSTSQPLLVGQQFFAICDPNDMLQARMIQGNTGTDTLTTYWDQTLAAFFADGNYLSIDLGGRIYSGECTVPSGGQLGTYSLTSTETDLTYSFSQPVPGLASALYVFQQAFAGTPAPDEGLLQDTIWEALCRGVAQNGVFSKAVSKGESTAQWNDASAWYGAKSTCHLYAKFLHYGTLVGTDSRTDPNNNAPIMIGNAVYGFSMDENPIGSYTGPNVPSKTLTNVPGGATVSLVIGPWDVPPPA
ncbi:hypothetical protein GE253_11970 [Niveispirillum sp. SYP-B3756]|uniref:hypothetical protein n=1 Tax=Niveispirillum sp. SYP-B3756 TaxID=2662178 RepID=UPI00129298BD|nr:hypothetical protein [Niveispirillum sp. SYP-B3756]MQP66057.1 hypothetical protein [Niveispirillum sp. SYP-B3756]